MNVKTMSLLLVSFGLGILPSMAFADATGSDKERARGFFDQGIQKIHEGKCEDTPVGDLDKCREAREMFSRAHSLDPDALGILRNLAQIEEHLGLLASASAHYRDLAVKAPLDPKPERRAWADLAKSALTSLQPRLAHLTVTVSSPPPETQVKVDGEPAAPSAWGAPMEIDPGSHALLAQAPGRSPFETRFELREGEGRTVRVELVPSTPAHAGPDVSRSTDTKGASPTATSATTTTSSASATATTATTTTTTILTRRQLVRIAPWVLVGAGALTVGVASAFGIAAVGQYNSACPADATTCSRGEYDKGAGWADASTVLFVAGGAAVAGGLVWHFVFQSGPKDLAPKAGALVPTAGPGALGIKGYF